MSSAMTVGGASTFSAVGPRVARAWEFARTDTQVCVPGGPLRLTLRGRRVVALAVAVLLSTLIIGLMAAIGAMAQGAVAGATIPATSTEAAPVALVGAVGANSSSIVVGPGETLWGIVSREMPGRDPREAIVEIRQANGLTGAEVVPGQRLTIPSR